MAESHCLYFWDMSLIEGAVGHIALKVVGPEEDGEMYISHWREHETWIKRAKGKRNQESLLDDIKAEGNRKPKIVQIPFDFLDPAEIDKWLPIDTQNPEKLYHLTDWNCADVVCKALQIGLRARSLQHELEKIFMSKGKIVVTPKEVFSWVQNKVQVYKIVKKQHISLEAASAHSYPCAPLKPTSNFSGRSAHLLNVCEALKSPSKTLVVTAGTGGVGKTEFARKVAEIVSDFFGGRVFWMDSETQESLQKCLLDLFFHLKIPHDIKFEAKLTMSNQEMKKLFHDIYSRFSTSNQNSLFIFDNANQFEPTSSPTANESIFLISDFLPNSFPPTTFSRCPAILITSRRSDWAESEDFQMINLHNFTFKETHEYLKNTFPKISADELKECEPEIKELHRRFDGYTLAFTLAAGWIRGAGYSRNVKEGLKCYLQFLERPSNNLHKKDGSSSSSDNNYKFDPHEIMEQTCSAIGRKDSLALKLLRQMSFLSPDFLAVEDCVDLNPEHDRKDIHSALDVLSKFNVIKDFTGEMIPKTRYELRRKFTVTNIQIHRVIQQLVKESQTKSKDVSILFDICEHQRERSTIPHLKSLVHNLQEFRETLSFWFLIKKPKCKDYIKHLTLQIQNLQSDDYHSLKAISVKLVNLHPPIDRENVMDNSDCLDESNQLYKITYQELANFALLNLLEENRPELYRECSIAVVKQLQSLEIWPQFSYDKALSWLTSRSLSYNIEFEVDMITICLKNPHTTIQQRQELEYLKMRFELKDGRCFKTEENAQNWLSILQHQMLNGRPFSLREDDKWIIMEDGIKAAVFSTTLDDHKYSQFLNMIRENSKTVDPFVFGNTLAQNLFRWMPHVLYRYKAPPNTQRFTEMLLLLFKLAQPFPSKYLDRFLSQLEQENNVFIESMDFEGLFCRFAMVISILSVSKSEEFVSQIDSYFKRLFEISKSKPFKGIKTNCQPRDREIVKGFLPYLNSFVEQNQDSKDENANELAKVVQLLILNSESTERYE